MPKVDKIDAFSLVVKSLEKGDEKKANEMMRILIKSIRQSNKENHKASNQIEIKDARDAKLFEAIILAEN